MLAVAERSTHRRLPYFHGHKWKARSPYFIVDPALNLAVSLLSGQTSCVVSSKLAGKRNFWVITKPRPLLSNFFYHQSSIAAMNKWHI
jgi:hypothetical protein